MHSGSSDRMQELMDFFRHFLRLVPFGIEPGSWIFRASMKALRFEALRNSLVDKFFHYLWIFHSSPVPEVSGDKHLDWIPYHVDVDRLPESETLKINEMNMPVNDQG